MNEDMVWRNKNEEVHEVKNKPEDGKNARPDVEPENRKPLLRGLRPDRERKDMTVIVNETITPASVRKTKHSDFFVLLHQSAAPNVFSGSGGTETEQKRKPERELGRKNKKARLCRSG